MPPNEENPHAVIEPSGLRAANAAVVQYILMKPVPDGAPVPPYVVSPHAVIEPSDLRAAKA